MYAVVRYGGKQYRVAPGDTIRVERLEGKVGSKVTFPDIIAVRTDEKLISGDGAAKAKVVGHIVAQDRHPKVLVTKYRKTKQYRITRGHRQNYTAVEVKEINL